MDVRAELVDAMKAALRTRAAPGDVIAVVGKMLAGSEAGSLADDLLAFDDQVAAIRLKNRPFSSEKGDGAILSVLDGDEVDERMRRSGREAIAAMVVAQPVELGREAGYFNRNLCHASNPNVTLQRRHRRRSSCRAPL